MTVNFYIFNEANTGLLEPDKYHLARIKATSQWLLEAVKSDELQLVDGLVKVKARLRVFGDALVVHLYDVLTMPTRPDEMLVFAVTDTNDEAAASIWTNLSHISVTNRGKASHRALPAPWCGVVKTVGLAARLDLPYILSSFIELCALAWLTRPRES